MLICLLVCLFSFTVHVISVTVSNQLFFLCYAYWHPPFCANVVNHLNLNFSFSQQKTTEVAQKHNLSVSSIYFYLYVGMFVCAIKQQKTCCMPNYFSFFPCQQKYHLHYVFLYLGSTYCNFFFN